MSHRNLRPATRRRIANMILALSLVAVASSYVASNAEAACYYPRQVTITYWEGVIISPQPPDQVIGECTTDCDGNTTCWGYQQSQNAGWYSYSTREMNSCPPVCE